MGVVVQDSFTEAANAVLESHTPDIGTSWTRIWQTVAGVDAIINGASDSLGQQGTGNSGAAYTADATYDSADYDVESTINGLPNVSAAAWYLLARLTDIDNLYAVRIRGTVATGTVQMYVKNAGIWTAIGSSLAMPAVGTVIKFELRASTLKIFFDGVEQVSVTDATFSAAGVAGLMMGGGAESTASGDDPTGTYRLDDFKVTTVSAGPTAQAILIG